MGGGGGSKSAKGGPNPLADMDRKGPNPLADVDRGVHTNSYKINIQVCASFTCQTKVKANLEP